MADEITLSDIPEFAQLSLFVVWNTKPLKEKVKPTPKQDPFESAVWRDEMLPLNKLKKPTSNRVPIIIYFPGTFCPIHAGHIHTLQTAKTYIESLGVLPFL